MATDISPIFGMTLLQLAEAASIAVACAIAASIFVNVELSKRSRKQLERHVQENNRREDKYRSAQILSDIMKTTKEFRRGIDHLLDGKNLTENDYDDLTRFTTYLTLLALCRRDGLVDSEYVGVMCGPILEMLTDRKLEEILGYVPGEFERNPNLYSGLREMRKLLTGV